MIKKNKIHKKESNKYRNTIITKPTKVAEKPHSFADRSTSGGLDTIYTFEGNMVRR